MKCCSPTFGLRSSLVGRLAVISDKVGQYLHLLLPKARIRGDRTTLRNFPSSGERESAASPRPIWRGGAPRSWSDVDFDRGQNGLSLTHPLCTLELCQRAVEIPVQIYRNRDVLRVHVERQALGKSTSSLLR